VTAARGASSPQSIAYTVTITSYSHIDSFVIQSMPDPEFSAGVNRAVYIAGISVNGYPLSEGDGTSTSNTSGDGAWSIMWSGTSLTQDVTEHQNLFFGATTDNDIIVGGPGNDTIDGGTGVDVAVYSGKFADYTITKITSGYTVQDNVGNDGIDTLSNIELLQFADRLVDLRTDKARLMPVVEFYNASLDHYFITWLPVERANLYLRKTPTPWVPTGFSFNSFAEAQDNSSAVCRFYIPPQYGDSHFFGRGAAECTATAQQHPNFILEDSQFMNVVLPSNGICPASTVPVYRVFSNRADANHRYTTDRAVRDRMVAKGWVAEGDGPDLVAMCAPQ